MADTKITGLTAIASLATGDLIPVVDDPAGTPVTTKATMAQVATLMASELVSDTAYASSWNGVTDDAPSKNAVYDKFEGFLHPGYIALNWYVTQGAYVTTTSGVAANTVYYCPFVLTRRVTISDLGAEVTTSHSGQAFGLAIYAHNATTGRPTGSPLAATGDMSTTSAAKVTADITGANVTLDPGIYWQANWSNSGTAQYMAHSLSATNSFFVTTIGTTSSSNITGGAWYMAGVSSAETFNTAAWPDATSETFTEIYNAGRFPIIMMKAA